MNDTPVYVSNCTKKSLWQKYEIYRDRVELHTWAGTFKIPMDQIKDVEVYPPVLKSLRLHLRKCLPVGLKLDTTDFSEHVILDKKSGFVRHVLFTPEDPAEFKRGSHPDTRKLQPAASPIAFPKQTMTTMQ